MKVYYSLIKYVPNADRGESFNVGMVMVCPEHNLSRFEYSIDKIKKINQVFVLKKSRLFDNAISGINKNTEKGDFEYSDLKYLSVYENGVIRYSSPKVMIFESTIQTNSYNHLFDRKYIALYNQLVDDKAFQAKKEKSKPKLSTDFRNRAKNNDLLKKSLDIDYKVSPDIFNNQVLIPEIKLDYIGGNGTVYCGNFLNMCIQEDRLVRNIMETIWIYDLFADYYNHANDTHKKTRKIILDEKQLGSGAADKALNLIDLHIRKDESLEVVKVADVNVFINKMLEEVKKNNIEPFTAWKEKNKASPISGMR